MYCLFCGNKLPIGSKFCNECGKKVKTLKTDRHPSANANTVFVWALVLFSLCSVVKTLLRWVLFGVWWNFVTLISVVLSLIIGLTTTLVLRKCGLIKPEKIKKGIVSFSVALLIIEIGNSCDILFVRRVSGWFFGGITESAVNWMEEYAYQAEDVLGANTLWLWGLFILFMLLKSESIKLKKYQSAIMSAVIMVLTIAWAVVIDIAIMSELYSRLSHWVGNVFHMAKLCCNGYVITIAFGRIILYWFALLAGKGKIGTVRSIIFAAVLLVGARLAPIYIAPFYGLWGASVALSFGYPLGAVILLTGLIKKRTLPDTEQNSLLTKFNNAI